MNGAPADQDNMHRFMNVADALVTCQVAPGQRRLRLSHLPERSVALNIAVSCGIASFFVLYFGLLLVFFTVRAHVCSFWVAVISQNVRLTIPGPMWYINVLCLSL